MGLQKRLCLLAVFALLAGCALPPAEPVTTMGDLYLGSVSVAAEDRDPLHDGYNDTVNVSVTVEYRSSSGSASYHVTCYLNDSAGRNVMTGNASGQTDPGTVTLNIVLGTSATDAMGTYTVDTVLAGNDSRLRFQDRDSSTIFLYPSGAYRPEISSGDTGPRLLGAGNSTRYVFNLTNSGNCPDTIRLSAVSALGWAARLGSECATLGPGERLQISLNVTLPAGAPPGSNDTETVTARSTKDPAASSTLEFRTRLAPFKGNLSVKYAADARTVNPGQAAIYSFYVVNNASSADNVTLSCSPLPAGLSAGFESQNITVPAGKTSEWLTFYISASGNYSGPSEIRITVTATSMDGETSAGFVTVTKLLLLDIVVPAASVSFSNDRPSAGDTITITAGVLNLGQINIEGLRVRFLNDSNVIATEMIQRLPAGAAKNVSAVWSVAPGTSVIRVVADPDCLIAGLNRSGSAAERRISALAPDLSVAPGDVRFSGKAPAAGTVAAVSVTVRNGGAGRATNITVELFCDNASLGTQNISAIEGKGGAGTVKFYWPATEGSHNFTVKVDGGDTVPETTEANNIADKELSVGKGNGPDVFIPGFPAGILLLAFLALALSRARRDGPKGS